MGDYTDSSQYEHEAGKYYHELGLAENRMHELIKEMSEAHPNELYYTTDWILRAKEIAAVLWPEEER